MSCIIIEPIFPIRLTTPISFNYYYDIHNALKDKRDKLNDYVYEKNEKLIELDEKKRL
jgi:hypothetical protein